MSGRAHLHGPASRPASFLRVVSEPTQPLPHSPHSSRPPSCSRSHRIPPYFPHSRSRFRRVGPRGPSTEATWRLVLVPPALSARVAGGLASIAAQLLEHLVLDLSAAGPLLRHSLNLSKAISSLASRSCRSCRKSLALALGVPPGRALQGLKDSIRQAFATAWSNAAISSNPATGR